jgi:hypothetical protein
MNEMKNNHEFHFLGLKQVIAQITVNVQCFSYLQLVSGLPTDFLTMLSCAKVLLLGGGFSLDAK